VKNDSYYNNEMVLTAAGNFKLLMEQNMVVSLSDKIERTHKCIFFICPLEQIVGW
jgi:hypothetical protein